jgi:molybdopterin converting factor small subunit
MKQSTGTTIMAQVTVNLYAAFRRHVDGKPSVDVQIEPGQTIEQVLDQLGVPAAQTQIIFCDNRTAELTHPLTGGETVGIFPAIGGG